MTDEESIIADAIARSLNPVLVGYDKADIRRAFGFIISAMSLDCPCTNIEESCDDVRAAAEAHYAFNAKQALQ